MATAALELSSAFWRLSRAPFGADSTTQDAGARLMYAYGILSVFGPRLPPIQLAPTGPIYQNFRDSLLVHGGERLLLGEPLPKNKKRRIANWKQLKFLSIICRALLANFMIYSIPRYWIQTMAAPRWFHKALQADVYQLLWERDPSFDVEHVGTDSSAYK
eukprot:scaffold4749_cov137-Isochrysis_galbana.AAC.7